MAFFAFSGGEKTKPIQSQFKANLKRNHGFFHMAQEIATALRASH
jgi:hypothetical protein